MFATNLKHKIMKKLFLTLVLVGGLTSVNAQTETEKSTETGYNKWSIEANAGINKATGLFTDGYFPGTGAPFNVDFGARYMFNSKFGLKTDFGFYSFKEFRRSLPFKTEYRRANIQAVLNLARVMNFEQFTKHFNILFHTGIGYGIVRGSERIDNEKTEQVANVIVGLGAQYKLSSKIALNVDVTSITNFSQDYTFDGKTKLERRDGLGGGIFSATLGLTYYLGKNGQHADWYFETDKNKEEIAALKKKLADVETLMNDSDKDGVQDYLDTEPNTMPGVAVNSKGIAIDKNNNKVPDEIESYLTKTYGDGKSDNSNTHVESNLLVKNLINEGYFAAYFDYNKSEPTNVSSDGIDQILTYLRNNPTATVEISGHADELGKSEYNKKLSEARAASVKSVLIKAKIAESRLIIVPVGEDASVSSDSELARKLVRKVTFKVK
jgi:OOP family OmpA-OmpF porin